jgi:hypothetical protein
MSEQPNWKHVGSIGDRDPIAYGGGFIYEDTTGVYAPEVVYFEPAPDEEWHKTEGQTPVTVYRFILERDSQVEWWYDRLSDVAEYTEQMLEVLQAHAIGTLEQRAQLYSDLISYHGAENFDSYPVQMTEDEAYAKYDAEMTATRKGEY